MQPPLVRKPMSVSFAQSRSSGHYSKLASIVEGWNIGWPVHWVLLSSSATSSPILHRVRKSILPRPLHNPTSSIQPSHNPQTGCNLTTGHVGDVRRGLRVCHLQGSCLKTEEEKKIHQLKSKQLWSVRTLGTAGTVGVTLMVLKRLYLDDSYVNRLLYR